MFRKIKSFYPKYILSRTKFKNKGHFECGKNVKVVKSDVKIYPGGKLVLEDGVVLNSIKLRVKGNCVINKKTIIQGVNQVLNVSIDGNCFIGSFSRINADILIRFGGVLKFGNHSNINFGSEIRVDESVTIGDYSRLSYGVHVWDTNTHNVYSNEKRRSLINDNYPVFGYEYEKPSTKPVLVGDDCWIGKDSMLLKGTTVMNGAIVGTHTILSNKIVPSETVVIQRSELKFYTKKVVD